MSQQYILKDNSLVTIGEIYEGISIYNKNKKVTGALNKIIDAENQIAILLIGKEQKPYKVNANTLKK